MTCMIHSKNLYFTLNKVSRNEQIAYIFIGNIKPSIKDKLEILEKGKNIKLDKSLDEYKEYIKTWNEFIKKNVKIKFIYDLIEINDSIGNIRKKIFYYCSNPNKNNFILPENQELWVKNKNNENEIIGFYYENMNNDKIKMKPLVNEKKKENMNIKKNIKYKINNSENNILINDLIDFIGIKNNIIYFSDALEEYNYFKKKLKKINNSKITLYFKKHFPYLNLNINKKNIENKFKLLKEKFKKEEYLKSIDTKYNKDNLLGNCNITNISLKINQHVTNSIEEIDLYQVFDYIRDKKLGDDIPFIKYADDSFQIPISLVSVEALEQNKVDKSIVNEWIGINKITNKYNGLILRQFLKKYNNKQKYIYLFLKKNTELLFNLRFDENDQATIKDIIEGVNNTKKLIEQINRNLISKKINKVQKINAPEITFKNNELILKDNTQLKYCNVYIPFLKKLNINFKKLHEFSKKFPDYLYDNSKKLNVKDQQRFETKIKLIYKKVSGFIPMSDILLDIDILKHQKETESNIIEILSSKYQKSNEVISEIIEEWKKKFGSYMTKKIDSEFKVGVEIEINNQGIKLSHITQIYQIGIIYNFLRLFMGIYFDNKINLNKLNINNNNSNEESFIYNNNSNNSNNNNNNSNNMFHSLININAIQNTLDSKFENDNSVNNKNIINQELLNNNFKEGIARDSEIAPEIALKCEDAISNQDRCENMCNDKSYLIRRLQRYDNYLFRYAVDDKKKNNKKLGYSKVCGVERQPIILDYNPDEREDIKKNAYSYSLEYSSQPEKYKRWYICPNIWCPVCEVPISKEDIDNKTIKEYKLLDGSLCKKAKCPYGNHEVMIRETNQIFPGFAEGTHPSGKCLPCCFKKSHNVKTSAFYSRFKKCLGEDINNNSSNKGELYILGKESPIDKNRYGILPVQVARILNTTLETGYLGMNSGYLKKGIKHKKDQSFISCLLDIISCNKNNNQLNEVSLKKMMIEKLNIDLYKSLYNGNLELIFNPQNDRLTSFENFKYYLLNDEIVINYIYLWDFIQRENILFEKGINLIIFENNKIICPFGDSIINYYDNDKDSILMLKSGNYFEPIYYLEGNETNINKKCIFNSKIIEIDNCIKKASQFCKDEYTIDWTKVLEENVKLNNIKIDNPSYELEYDLTFVLNELNEAIKNKNIDKSYLPKTQYIDGNNKVFGLLLTNNLYLPIKPSRLLDWFPYKTVLNMNELALLKYKDVFKLTKNIYKNTKIKLIIKHKILDNKDQKNIIALLNSNNRIIPVKEEINKDTILKVAVTKYFSEINEFINNKNIIHDERIEKINKKNFENETYERIRYELSIFIQKNKKYYDEIIKIINEDNQYNSNKLDQSRKKMYSLLNKIFSELSSQKFKNINFGNYKTPNKRIPCGNRDIKKNKKNNYETLFTCESDPHCVTDKNKCKLYISKNNLIDMFKNIKNYDYYLSELLDELLRFKIKREELLNNEIENIIHKNYVPENNKKYLIIQTYNITEIENKLKQLFYDNKGIFISTKKLYDKSSTTQYAFNKNLYLMNKKINLNKNDLNDLSVYWTKILGNDFKIKKNYSDIFSIFKDVLSSFKNSNIKYKNIQTSDIRNDLIKYWTDSIKNSRNMNKTQKNIYNLYKEKCAKLIKNIKDYEELIQYFSNIQYKGCNIDLTILSKVYQLNIIILDKRMINKNEGYEVIKNIDSKYYICIYRSKIQSEYLYNVVVKKNKFVFKLEDFTPKFIENILKIN